MALNSESAIGNKLSQYTSGSDTPVSQPDQFRNPDGRMAQSSRKNPYCIEVSVGTERRIKVIRHSFACEICDGLHTIKWKIESVSALGDSGSLHFDGDGAQSAHAALLRGGSRHV